MENLYNLGVIVSLSDLASKKLDDLKNKWESFREGADKSSEAVKRFDSGMKNLKIGSGLVGIGVALKGLLDGPIENSKLFQKELALLGATANATESDMKKFESAALQAGLDTKFSPREAAAGLTALASAGIQGADAINSALIPALDLASASAGKLSVDDAAADMAAAMSSFKRPAGEVADTFVNMANVASFSIQDLGSAWRGVNLAASSTNQSMSTTGAVMSALKNAGATAIGSGEGVRMALSALATPSLQASKALEKLGVSAYDGNGKFRDLIDIFQDLDVATKNMSEADRNAYLDKILLEGGTKAFLAVQNQGINTVRGYASTLKEQGSASAFAKRQVDTYNGASEILNGTLETISTLIGNGVTPALKTMKEMFTALLTPVASFLRESPNFLKVAGYVAVILSGLLILSGAIFAVSGAFSVLNALVSANIITNTILVGVVKVVTAVKTFMTGGEWASIAATKASIIARNTNIAVLGIERTSMTISTALYAVKTGAMSKATFAQWALNSAMSANPIGAVVLAIVALIGVIVLAVKYYDEWTSWLSKLASSTMDLYRENQLLVSGILLLIGPVGWLIQGALSLAENWDKVTSSIQTAYNWIRKFSGTSESTIALEGSMKKVGAELDSLNAKRDKAQKFGLDSDVKKYDSEISKLEANKKGLETNLQKESDYQKMLKDTSTLKSSLKSEMDKGSFGKSGSSEFESAQNKLNELEKKSKLSKDDFLKTGNTSKAIEDTNRLATATESLTKKQNLVSMKKQSAPSGLDLINMNNGAVFNGGQAPSNLPNLGSVKLPDKSFNSIGSKMETNMKSAVETVPVNMNELTSKLEKVLSDSGKKLGTAFVVEFKKAMEGLKFRDIELFFMKGMSGIFSKLNSMGFNAGRNLVNTYSSGVGKESGGSTQTGAMQSFTEKLVSWFNWSDAKRGPLSKTTQAGSNLIKTYSVGILKAKDVLDKPMDEVMKTPNDAVKNLSRNIAGESVGAKQNISSQQKNTNLNIDGIHISLDNGLKGIGKIIEDLIIQRAEAI